ncbi:hypothetical protein FNV43_RR19940 [Rhamnella rubrinervis]|uniref:Uncharacterized protein n=1 Tax=Rhamnella rubrinervis TaxID=2594499 RepID=A0A8K0GPZ7_9ROSA|nr:hypothetical protein FNV43_RR19940 [Rhamnella rubrinervis]
MAPDAVTWGILDIVHGRIRFFARGFDFAIPRHQITRRAAKQNLPETMYSKMPTGPVKLLSVLDGYITHKDDNDYNRIGEGGGIFRLSE